MCMYICMCEWLYMYVCIYVLVVPQLFDKMYSHSVIKSSVPGEYEHYRSKNRNPSDCLHKDERAIFSKTVLTILIKLQ
jgi:hypothetical protein